MISAWTKNLQTVEEVDRFTSSVIGSKVVLDRLKEILLEMQTDADTMERNAKIYEIPNWDYRQAHFNGFRDCLNKIKLIITLDPKDVK